MFQYYYLFFTGICKFALFRLRKPFWVKHVPKLQFVLGEIFILFHKGLIRLSYLYKQQLKHFGSITFDYVSLVWFAMRLA